MWLLYIVFVLFVFLLTRFSHTTTARFSGHVLIETGHSASSYVFRCNRLHGYDDVFFIVDPIYNTVTNFIGCTFLNAVDVVRLMKNLAVARYLRANHVIW